MNESQERAAAALDKAIAEVFCDEIDRLSRELDPIARAKKVDYALRQLAGLQRGAMPKYDEWVAPFYISWYQGSQINLTYSVISEILQDGVSLDGSLHIVDWGCGALAMQFGVALAAADAIRQGHAIDAIRIDLIDDSAPMVAIGKRIWDAFTRGLSQYPELIHVSQACEKIVFQEVGATAVKKIPGDCWVSAIHAVYQKNKDSPKEELSDIVNRLAPDMLFATTHNYPKEKSLLTEIFAFCNDEYTSEWTRPKRPRQFSGNLEDTTKRRRNLRSKILQQEPPPVADIGLIRRYLNGWVPWKGQPAAVRLYKIRRF